MPTTPSRRQPTLKGQLALVAGLQKRFNDLLDERLDKKQTAEALRIARWLNDSALCIARLKREIAAQGGSEIPPWLSEALKDMPRKKGAAAPQ